MKWLLSVAMVIGLGLNMALAGPVLTFNGKASGFTYVDMGAGKFPGLSDMTVEAWIKTSVKPGNNNYGSIVGQGYLGDEVGFGMFTSFTSDGTVAFQARNGSTLAQANMLYPFDGQWRHLAGVRKGDISRLYIDGELVNAFTNALSSIDAIRNFGIGARHTTSWGFPFNGTIAEVRLWNHARTVEEVQEHMSKRLDGGESGLLGYWPLNEGVGTVAMDTKSGGALRDGTIYNGAWSDDDDIYEILAASDDFIDLGFFKVSDIGIGSQQFTNSNEVNVVTFAVPAGCDRYQVTYSGEIDSIDNDKWLDVFTPPATLGFDLPIAESNITFYAWFTNSTDVIKLRRRKASITFVTLTAISSAPSFNGADSYVSLGTPPQLRLDGVPFTVEGWMLFDGMDARDMFYTKSIEKVGRGGPYSFMLGLNDNGTVMSAYTGEKGKPQNAWVTVPVLRQLQLGQWYHLAYTFDGYDISFYLDGALQGSLPFSYGDVPEHHVRIGGYTAQSDTMGRVSDVRVWNRAHSAARIRELMNVRLRGAEAGLLGYWPLDEAAGTTVLDHSGHNATGTLVSATWKLDLALSMRLPEQVPYISGEQFSAIDIETGNTRFTSSNEVRVAGLVIPDGYDKFQLSASGDVGHLAPEGWLPLAAMPQVTGFTRPDSNTNLALFAWFTNAAVAVPLVRLCAEFGYVTPPPVPSTLFVNGNVTDGNVNLGAPAELQLDGVPFTIEGWMYFNVFDTRDMLYTKNIATRAAPYSFMCGLYDNGKEMAAYTGEKGVPQNAWVNITLDTALQARQWYHVAFSFDGTVMSYFLNGNLKGSQPFSYGNVAAHTVKLGGYTAGSDINGRLREVRLWNYGRSGSAIHDAMARRLVGNEAGLIGYWPLDEGLGARKVVDRSPYGNDGALVGCSWGIDTLIGDMIGPAPDFAESFPIVVKALGSGNYRFTNTNEVMVASFPVPASATHYQVCLTPDIGAIEDEAWYVVTQPPQTLSWPLPISDTNIVFFIWFTNKTENAVLYRATANEMIYTRGLPAVAGRSTLSRSLLVGTPLTLGLRDIDTGTTGGTSGAVTGDQPLSLERLTLHLVSGPDTDGDPDEAVVSVIAEGQYVIALVASNEAANVATSLCTVTVSIYAGSEFVWTGGYNSDWHLADNWDAQAVPAAEATVIFNSGTIALTAPTAPLASFTMNGGTLTFNGWETCLEAAAVTLNGGTVTHAANTAASAPWTPNARVWFKATNMTIAAAAKIDANSKGYGINCGPGTSGSSHGGSHGGKGGMYNRTPNAALVGNTYGDVEYPEWPGSGGGGAATEAWPGGGVVKLELTGVLSHNGSITANGGLAVNYLYGGGGAGGSVMIVCAAISGSGAIEAAGTGGKAGFPLNNWGYYAGTGGGGRIAIHYGQAAQEGQNGIAKPELAINAGQGLGEIGETSRGHPGTIYVTDSQIFPAKVRGGIWYGFDILEVPSLTVDNGWAILNDLTNVSVAGDLTIKNSDTYLGLNNIARLDVGGDIIALNASPKNYTVMCRWHIRSADTNDTGRPWGTEVTAGGALSMSGSTTLAIYSDADNGSSTLIKARDIAIAAGATVTANGTGYGGGAQADGKGPGGGAMGAANSGNSSGGGGGYGGAGGQYETRGEGGPAYGWRKTPLHPGSGGGGRLGLATAGGAGGGLIRLAADDAMVINGTLTANGAAGPHANAGGGAGGGIYLTCRALDGVGVVRANGGAPGATSGGGAGGRVAIWRSVTRPGMAITAEALPGGGAAAGTVYWSAPGGTMLMLR